MWTFLKPYMKALRELESGVEFESPSRGKFICKAVLLLSRAIFLHAVLFVTACNTTGNMAVESAFRLAKL